VQSIAKTVSDSRFPFLPVRKKCAFLLLPTLTHCANIAPSSDEPKQTNKHKPMKTNTFTLAMLTLSTLDALALGTLNLNALEASLIGLLLCGTYAAALRQMR
jgi:hypothetical protein